MCAPELCSMTVTAAYPLKLRLPDEKLVTLEVLSEGNGSHAARACQKSGGGYVIDLWRCVLNDGFAMVDADVVRHLSILSCMKAYPSNEQINHDQLIHF